MNKEGWDPRQISNALKLWKSLYPKIAKSFHRPELWAAAVELAVARLELEGENAHSRIARKYGVEPGEAEAKCDEIWQRLKIQPFDPRFCSLPQILGDMIVEDEALQKQLALLSQKIKAPKEPKEPQPHPAEDLPPPSLDEYVEKLIARPRQTYSENDHLADLALDWYEEHGLQSTQKLLQRLINHFGMLSSDELNVNITADALVALGEVLQEEKQFAEAVPFFRRAADIHGNYPGALDDLAESLFATGQYREAIAAWREETEIEADNLHCFYRIADCYEKLGQTPEMVATLEDILRRHPGEIVARDRLRAHWISAGKASRAAECLRRILAVRAPEGIENVTLWVKYQLMATRFGVAGRFLDRYEEELGEQVELRVYLLKAIVMLARGQTEEAQNEIRRARALPNFCEHCWDRELGVIASRFGEDTAQRIRRLSTLV